MTDPMTDNGKNALARVWVSNHSGQDLKVDGRSMDPLVRRGLVEKERPRGPTTGHAIHYRLTDAGRDRCTQPDLLRLIHLHIRLERDRALTDRLDAEAMARRKAKRHEAMCEVLLVAGGVSR